MKISSLVESFIHPNHKTTDGQHRRARLFVRASLLTSLFSTSYIWLSLIFEYDKGVYLMTFNVVGFLVLSLLAKTRLSLTLLGHLYVFFGSTAVIVLTYFSGGMWSAIYPWIISIPVLALLVVGRQAGIIWAGIAFSFMVWFGVMAVMGMELPVEYNSELRTIWYFSILPGLLLIIMVVSLVFESTQTRAFNDVESKNKLLEEQTRTIKKQAGELEKLIDEKDHIIRILAHDLKSPLSNITIISDLLEKEPLNEEQLKYISMIDHASSNAQNLINRMLEMAFLDEGSIKVKLEKLKVYEAAQRAVDSIHEAAKRKSITINLAGDQESVVNADKTYLQQIFENLLSNAVKFSEVGKSVNVDIQSNGENVNIAVMDEGPGINPKEEDKLFQKFSRLSTRPTDNESSSGLGLSLVKQYVSQIEGKVWYDSERSSGATFIVQLPLAT